MDSKEGGAAESEAAAEGEAAETISTTGALKASARWGAVGVLYFEAGLAIYTSHQAMEQPLIDEDLP